MATTKGRKYPGKAERTGARRTGTSRPRKAVVRPSSRGDWREAALDRVRALILAAHPGIIEERKWKKPTRPAGVPVWSHNGIICTGESYTSVVKLTFARGARLPDRSRLFNAGLEGTTRRAIDIREGEEIDARAFTALVRSAVRLNGLEMNK